jgi:ABC-type glycerol-3-phosphate transport system permease component
LSRQRRARPGDVAARSGAQAMMLVIGLATLYPLYFVVITAFKTQHEYLTNRMWPPSNPTLANFHAAFRDGAIIKWATNSMILTVSSVAISTVIAAFAAYPLARSSFFGRRTFFGVNVVLMVVPPVVLIVPLYLLSITLGMINSRVFVTLVYVGLLVPFTIFVLVNFFATIPRSLEDAAAIDGAGALRTLWHVFVPLSAPAIMTVVVVNAVWVWNELLIALVFLQDNNARTLTAGLTFFQGRFTANDPLVMTGALIASIPMLLLFLVGQRFFVRGLSAGFGK